VRWAVHSFKVLPSVCSDLDTSTMGGLGSNSAVAPQIKKAKGRTWPEMLNGKHGRGTRGAFKCANPSRIKRR